MKLTDSLIKEIGFVQSKDDDRFFHLYTPKSCHILRRVEFYDSVAKRPLPNGEYQLHNSNEKLTDISVKTICDLLDAVKENGKHEGKVRIIGEFRSLLELNDND